MKTKVIPVTPFKQNCSLLICETTGHVAVIDPGGEIDHIEAILDEEQVKLEKIFLTHTHIDHCSGATLLAKRRQVPIEGPHEADLFWLERLPQQSKLFSLPHAEAFIPDRWLTDGERVHFGNEELEVYHCPGHTPGHVIFFSRAHQLAWVGDVLFSGTIGRTDFPLGNQAELIHSIRTKLWPLGDEVTFFPGHGPTSTFGKERRTNRYVGEEINA